jgi:hypothetical protein
LMEISGSKKKTNPAKRGRLCPQFIPFNLSFGKLFSSSVYRPFMQMSTCGPFRHCFMLKASRQWIGLFVDRHVDYLTTLFQLRNFKACIDEEAKMETASFHIRSIALFTSGFHGCL